MTNEQFESSDSSLPFEPEDYFLLRILRDRAERGSSWAPTSKLTLPSGRVLSGDVVRAFTNTYASDGEELQVQRSVGFEDAPRHSHVSDDPLSRENDHWTGNPELNRAQLVGRSMEALYQSKSSEVPNKKKNWLRRIIDGKSD